MNTILEGHVNTEEEVACSRRVVTDNRHTVLARLLAVSHRGILICP